jgi:hypothetical protein
MKYLLNGILVCISLCHANGQKWVEKTYTYESKPNITYGTAINFAGGIDTLKLDLFLPKCDDPTHDSKRPLMLWFHGGSFLAGNKEDASIQYLCKEFAKRGYVTASVQYRLGFVADDNLWQCNYPNYSCFFASDQAEWMRAYYRAVQDGKGALRYLINRSDTYRIDPQNVFISGESAGALLSLGIGLLDTENERPDQTRALSPAPKPNAGTLNCSYNVSKPLQNDMIERPDLGSIDGDIEPTNITFTIKGIGNIYGAIPFDLLKNIPSNKIKPAIYSFHQPCDIIVPIDSNYIYWGLNWCFTNGYNCHAIQNYNFKLYGSRTISDWNEKKGYGYDIHNEFTNVIFPYQFLFGTGSCLDQVNNPCHAYDNRNLREGNLAHFFASKITTNPYCDPNFVSATDDENLPKINVFPNPVSDILNIEANVELYAYRLNTMYGNTASQQFDLKTTKIQINITNLKPGVYILDIQYKNRKRWFSKIVVP